MSKELFNICIVDDEGQNNYVFKDYLEDYFEICDFTDPEVALKFILESKKTLAVVTDHSMPKISGIDLARVIKEKRPFLNIIMLTGNPENDNELMYNTLRKNFFFDFINKPFDFENETRDLVNIIKTACSRTWRDLIAYEASSAKEITDKYFDLDDYQKARSNLNQMKSVDSTIRMTMLFNRIEFFYPEKGFADIIEKDGKYLVKSSQKSFEDKLFNSLEEAGTYLKQAV